MGALYDALTDFFKEQNWAVERDAEHHVLNAAVAGDAGNWPFVAAADEERRMVLFYSLFPMPVEPDRLGPYCEFAARANCRVLLGGFEIEPEDAELRFKTCVPVGDGDLDASILETALYSNLVMMDNYLPALLKLSQPGAEAEALMREMEQADDEPEPGDDAED